MPAPYAILEASTALVGLVGSIVVIVVISVDSWEEADFSFTASNTSLLQIFVASSKTDVTTHSSRSSLTDAWSTYYYYYQYWGLWRICDLLTDAARNEMTSLGGEYREKCYNFVSEYDEESSTLQSDGKSVARLQNSGASCFIVCIIDLVAALGVGVIALLQKHVTACMVTGVLYCMANTARATMTTGGVDRKQCFNFLTDYDEESAFVSTNTKSFMGLQNSTVVCFMVTIIDLIVANFLAVLGIYKKQVPVCMIAGALYCIASVFTFFGLIIFHVKHHYERYYCQALYDIQESACSNRSLSIGWPVPVAWFGLILCVMDSILWGFLTQALRIIKTKTMSDRY